MILILCLERVLSSFTVARPAARQRRGFLRKLMANRENGCNLLVNQGAFALAIPPEWRHNPNCAFKTRTGDPGSVGQRSPDVVF
ncbi:MAG TPA: hypothetical protein VEV41_26345 [Terriglobales bacterium]|nr:hypothetical protein [Terriglobales bacterium]